MLGSKEKREAPMDWEKTTSVPEIKKRGRERKKIQYRNQENEMFRSRCLSRDRELNLSLATRHRWREGRRDYTASEENGYAASPTKSGIFKAGG